jgi:hypothetical protein
MILFPINWKSNYPTGPNSGMKSVIFNEVDVFGMIFTLNEMTRTRIFQDCSNLKQSGIQTAETKQNSDSTHDF